MKLLPSKGDQWELLGSHFKVGTKLGEGNYGQVYKGTLSMEVTREPAKKYIMMRTQEGKAPYTVAIKLLKGAPKLIDLDWIVIGWISRLEYLYKFPLHHTH